MLECLYMSWHMSVFVCLGKGVCTVFGRTVNGKVFHLEKFYFIQRNSRTEKFYFITGKKFQME